MTKTMSNGQAQRKSLSNEIDRLDTILDGLAEALNESVAEAVRDVVGSTVRLAVEASIKEVLANPDLLRSALAQHQASNPAPEPPPPAKRPTLVETLKGALSHLLGLGSRTVQQAGSALSSAWRCCLQKMQKTGLWARAGLASLAGASMFVLSGVWRFRSTCALALGLGVTTGLGSYLAGPLASAVLCGISGVGLTLSGLLAWPMLRLMLGGLHQQN